MSTRPIIRDVAQEAYDRARRAPREDRVLQTIVLPAWAGSYADVVAAAEAERRSAEAAVAVRAERHRRLWTALDRLKAGAA